MSTGGTFSGSRRKGVLRLTWRRGALLVAMFGTAIALVLVPTSALAVHDAGCPTSVNNSCLFELDGNVQNDSPSGGNLGGFDWGAGPGGPGVFNSNGTINPTVKADSNFLTADFSADYATPDTSYFATSAKDTDNVSSWQCGSSNNPTPKDEILNAYSALFSPTSGVDKGHVIFDAAAERQSNNGDSFMGFWLFKGAVGCNSPTGAATPFSGAHSVGDLLILSNFTGGGSNPLVQVYRWNGTGLTLLASGGFCSAATPTDEACGEVNTGTLPLTTWPNSTTTSQALAPNEFLEVGVDLTQLLDLTTNTIPCFARFQAETRSSQQTTAELKDFAGGKFNSCTSTTVTTPKAGTTTLSDSSAVPSSTVIHDEATVTGSALVGTAPNPVGTVTFSYCLTADQTSGGSTACAGSPTPAGTKTLTGVSNPATVSSDNIAANTLSAGRYCFTATYADTSTPPNYPDGSSDSTKTECFRIGPPHLTITKTADNPSTVNAGDPIGFTIALTSDGQATAHGATINDPLPGGTGTADPVHWTIASHSGDSPVCGITGSDGSQVLACGPQDLAVGSSITVHVTATTTATACGQYDNTASFSSTDASTGSASASATCNPPDISVTKTADASPVNAGDPIGFSITVANSDAAGTGTAKQVTLDDPLPAGSGTGVTWSLDSGPTGTVTPTCAVSNASPQHLTCSAVDLGPGDSYSVHVTATTSASECTQYDNTATASQEFGPDAQGSASITCAPPDLSISKTADNTTVNAGDPIGFTIEVSNSAAEGTGTAQNVTLSDPLPAGTATDWVIAPTYSGPGTCAITGPSGQQVLNCSFGNIEPDNSVSVHVSSSTSFAACTVYDNTATAHADNAPDLDASASIECNKADVSITKTADHSAPVHAGDQIGFSVEAKNTGEGDATGVVLNDPLPAGSGSGVTWSIDTSTGNPSQFVLSGAKGSQTLSLASSTLPAGADYKVHLVASTSETECSVYNNTATLTTGNANNPDPAHASESCVFRVDLAVTKAGSPATQTLGDGNITWTMVVTNNGPDVDTGVVVSDPMPAGNTYVSSSTTKGTCTGGAILNCTIGTMAAGESVTITLITTPSTVGAQTNTVNVVGDRPETNTANNTATATVQTVGVITPPKPCIAVSKVTPKQLFVGRKTTLTIHLTQGGKAVKGIHVRIQGAKINLRTGASNSKGVVKQTLKMKKAGILIFSPIASKRCNTQRVGVTNVFTPPVTG